MITEADYSWSEMKSMVWCHFPSGNTNLIIAKYTNSCMLTFPVKIASEISWIVIGIDPLRGKQAIKHLDLFFPNNEICYTDWNNNTYVSFFRCDCTVEKYGD